MPFIYPDAWGRDEFSTDAVDKSVRIVLRFPLSCRR